MFRHIIGYANTPIQQALTKDRRAYKSMNITHSMLGIVISVEPADSDDNRSASFSFNRHGFAHEATVLVIEDGNNTRLLLEHVVVTPDRPCGVDDYYEHLPRGSNLSLDGNSFNRTLQGINPSELDGDWCVVDFIGGSIDQPYISRWWPHNRNVYDTQTSGQGHSDENGVPQALDQLGRVFERVNGVEKIISPEGDIYISTYYSNNVINPNATHSKGRYPRDRRPGKGGSIGITIKESQSFTMNFNAPADGVTPAGGQEDSLPQSNPPTDVLGSYSRVNTIISADRRTFNVSSPGLVSLASEGPFIIQGEYTKITASSDFTNAVKENRRVTVDGFSSQVVKGKYNLHSLEEVNIKSGYAANTGEPLGPLNVLSTGDMEIRAGILIDTSNPPTTPAVPANLSIHPTGNLSIIVGNEDDANIPPANYTLDITGTGDVTLEDSYTLQSNNVVYLHGESAVNLGSTSDLSDSTNSLLLNSFVNDATLNSTLNTARAAATGSPPQNAAAITAVLTALDALVSALQSNVTTITKAK